LASPRGIGEITHSFLLIALLSFRVDYGASAPETA